MARINFTAGRIDAFVCEAGKAQSIIYDSTVPVLGLRATPNGKKTYVFQSKLNGADIRMTIGKPGIWSIAEAQREARRLQTIIDEGRDPRLVKEDTLAAEQAARDAREKEQADKIAKDEQNNLKASLMVLDAWKAYLAHHEGIWGERHMTDHFNLSQAGGAAKKRGKGTTVRGVLYPLLEKRMVEISLDVLVKWQVAEAAIRANNARQGFESFRAFWRWCATRDEYKNIVDKELVEHPDLRIKVPSRKAKPFDVLERSQMRAWFSEVRNLTNPTVKAYLQILVLTGARREELIELKWEHVNFLWSSIWIKDKVEKHGRKIPLTPYAAMLLKGLPKRNEWVFSSGNSDSGHITEPRKAHNRALAAAKLPHVSLHGLRRTFASLVEWVEVPSGVVAQIMGHKPSATAERHYKHRPLELLAIWHAKYEAWILEQANVEFISSQEGAVGIGQTKVAPINRAEMRKSLQINGKKPVSMLAFAAKARTKRTSMKSKMQA